MRWVVFLAALLQAAQALGQAAWMPLSREVERPYASELQTFGSDAHTAIRPYRQRDIHALAGHDTLRPKAALPALDRWAGARNGRDFRWGPLAEASMGLESGGADPWRHRGSGGFWTDLDVGDKLNFHLDAQIWNQRPPGYLDTLIRAAQVAPREGHAYGAGPNLTHYDWNGHVSWDPGKFFNFTLGHGRNAFGEGHRSFMLSDEAYSYPYLRITTSVWKIRYVNLFTRMSDFRDAGGDPDRYRGKYSSMHYLSWNVSKRINIALFEAIVWSSGDSLYPRGFDFNYVNPIIFYRPVEFDIGSPDNALLGIGLNVKVGKGTLIYSQFVLDEFLLAQVRSGDGWYANKQAVQVGAVARNALNTPGLTVRLEWNFVRPFMYTHSDTRQNYAHFGQPLAHPYGSNLQELVLHAERDQGRWHYGFRGSMAWMGTDTEDSYGNNIFRPELDRPRLPDNVIINYGYRVGNAEVATLFHGQLRAGYLVDPATATRVELSFLYRQHSQEDVGPATTHFLRLGLLCHFRQQNVEQQVRYVLP